MVVSTHKGVNISQGDMDSGVDILATEVTEVDIWFL